MIYCRGHGWVQLRSLDRWNELLAVWDESNWCQWKYLTNMSQLYAIVKSVKIFDAAWRYDVVLLVIAELSWPLQLRLCLCHLSGGGHLFATWQGRILPQWLRGGWQDFQATLRSAGTDHTKISIDFKVHHLGFGHWEYLHRALRVQGLVLACLQAGQSLVLAVAQIGKWRKW